MDHGDSLVRICGTTSMYVMIDDPPWRRSTELHSDCFERFVLFGGSTWVDAYRLTSVSSNFRMSDKAIVAFQKAQTRRFGVCYGAPLPRVSLFDIVGFLHICVRKLRSLVWQPILTFLVCLIRVLDVNGTIGRTTRRCADGSITTQDS